MTWSSKKWNVVGSASTVLVFLAVIAGDTILNHPRAKVLHQEILREFGVIAPPGGVVKKEASDNYSLLRNHQGSVGANYYTNEHESDIHRYYDQELGAKGWQSVAIADWGNEREVFYCKPPLYASLEFLGDIPGSERSSERFAYAFHVSWAGGPLNALFVEWGSWTSKRQ
jgi:hypothetical protein